MVRFSARLYSYLVLRSAEFGQRPSNPLKFVTIAAERRLPFASVPVARERELD
jgi:hypothetical protein